MKKNYLIKRTLSAVLLLMMSSLMWGQYFEVDGMRYAILSETEVEVAYQYYEGQVVIPSSVSYEGKTYSVTSIGGLAFQGCSSLTSVEIPNSVTSIGGSAFMNCSSLTSVVIPNSVTSIEWFAFVGCSSLTSVEIPNSVTSIGANAFCNCSSLTSVVIPNSVTSIVEGTFSGCSSLTSVEIPNSVTSIGGYTFQDCSSLTSVEIPNSVTSIGDNAFEYCSSLTSVEIPNSVTSIGSLAFNNCSSLTSVICYAEDVPELGWDVFRDVPQSEATLYVPASALEAYKAADQWKEFGTILPIEDANGISSTTAEQETDATYYTLDGVSVKNPTKKGIYIKNGKKILFR